MAALVKTEFDHTNQMKSHKMSFNFYTMSRSELQSLPEKRRKDAIARAVDSVYQQVIAAATEGKKFCIVDISRITNLRNGSHSYPPPYIPTEMDMVEGFKAKFPDCNVQYEETWEDTQPGVRQQKKGILVDWS